MKMDAPTAIETMRHESHKLSTCRSCGGDDLHTFLDLGMMPLVDRLIDPEKVSEVEPKFPLEVAFCSDCTLVQITETVDPSVLLAEDYPYYSSFSPALLKHSRLNALARIEDRRLGPKSLVVELASNDGYLLKNYVEAGVPVLGIDPASGPVASARKIGVNTIEAFFTENLAKELVEENKSADVVHANNVLAHVADLNAFVAGIRTLLKPNGVAIFEVPYLLPLIEHIEFDTIYHEHLCYFSVTALNSLFKRHDFHLNHIEHLSIHGGSLRLFVEHTENQGASVLDQMSTERSIGLDRVAYFEGFSERVNGLKSELVAMIKKLNNEGHTVAAYGASAKGAIMLNFCKLSTEHVEFVVDRNVHKQGKLMPGVHLPILPPETLAEEPPDYLLLLA